MATKTTTKKMTVKSLNESLVNATTAAINATVENGEKWQKLTKKLIKKSEPVRRKQMNMVFDTAEAVKTQFATGTERAKELVEFDQVIEFVSNNPVSQKVYSVSEDIKEGVDGIKDTAVNIKNKVSENRVVQQLSKTSENLKSKGTAKFNDIKEDVLEQAQTILNKGEKMVEDALGTKKVQKAEATTATKAAAKPKATAAKTTTKAKATTAKRTTRAKAAAPKATATATKTTAAKAKAPVAKKATQTVKATPAKAATTVEKAAESK